MPLDKIKRNFVWLRKTLGIIDKTTLPGEILGEVRPTLDTFGWDRLQEETTQAASAAAPAVAVASADPAAGVVRLILAASMLHTDTGVNHVGWLTKRQQPGALDIGIPTDRPDIDATEHMSMIGQTFLMENQFLIGTIIGAPVAGTLQLRIFFVDLDEGEYLPAL